MRPTPSNPVVVSILTINQAQLLTDCLESLFLDPPTVPFLVHVFDQASTDLTPEVLARFQERFPEQLVVHRHPENIHFVRANNLVFDGYPKSDVVILNDDTILLHGWLDTLVERAYSAPDIGIVGSRLIYPNGVLQEAGGEIFRDASGQNIGKWDDPARPEFEAVKDVHYCSGALLYIRREVLDQVGGFDPQLAPAYYEDTDLCFKAREAGWRVIYEPASAIIHREGATNGVDTATGVKRYQEVNRHYFVKKWEAVLAHHRRGMWEHPGPVQGKHVLVIHLMPPLFDQASGDRRLYEMLVALATHNRVTFLAVDDRGLEPYTEALRAAGVHAVANDVARWPAFGRDGARPPRCATLEELLDQNEFDLAILEFYHQARIYLPELRRLAPDLPVVVDSVDVHFLRERREAQISGRPLDSWRAEATFRNEVSTYERAEAVITVTENDRAALLEYSRELQVPVIPNLHTVVDQAPGDENRAGLIFVGGYRHPPNIDAVLWFAAEILPRIRARFPDLPVTFAGSDPPPEIRALAGPNVFVPGYIPEIEPVLDGSLISIAPLRYGAGMKGKIGEALGRGLPVVTTNIGAEGMRLEDGVHALLADDPEAFAAAVIRLLEDRALWQRLQDNGRRHVADNWGIPAVTRQIEALVSSVAPASNRGSRRHLLNLDQIIPAPKVPGILGLLVFGTNAGSAAAMIGQVQRAHGGEIDPVVLIPPGGAADWLPWAAKDGYRILEVEGHLNELVSRIQPALAGEEILLIEDSLVFFRSTLQELRRTLDRQPEASTAVAGALPLAPIRPGDTDESREVAAARVSSTQDRFVAALAGLFRPGRLRPGDSFQLSQAVAALSARVIDPRLTPRPALSVAARPGLALGLLGRPGAPRPILPQLGDAVSVDYFPANGRPLGSRLIPFLKTAQRRHLLLLDQDISFDQSSLEDWLPKIDGAGGALVQIVLAAETDLLGQRTPPSIFESRLAADLPGALSLLSLAKPALAWSDVTPALFDPERDGTDLLLWASLRSGMARRGRLETNLRTGFRIPEFPSPQELLAHVTAQSGLLRKISQGLDRLEEQGRFVNLARFALAAGEADQLLAQALELLQHSAPDERRYSLWNQYPLIWEIALVRAQISAAQRLLPCIEERLPRSAQDRHLQLSLIGRESWPREAAGCARAVLSLVWLAAGNGGEAYAAAQAAVAEAGKHRLTRFALAQAALALGRTEEALDNLALVRELASTRVAVELFPEHPGFLRGLVLELSLALKLGQPAAALAILEQVEARRIRPSHQFGAKVMELRALALEQLGQPKQAHIARISSRALFPNVPDRPLKRPAPELQDQDPAEVG